MLQFIIDVCVAFASIGYVRGMTILKIGQDIDWPPYAYADSVTGELVGFGKAIADGMSKICPHLQFEVVRSKWTDCWTDGNLGTLIRNGSLDGCMVYTHTKGSRDEFAEFSLAILNDRRAAGLLSALVDGQPKVTGYDDLSGKTIVDVGGWAPTEDTIKDVVNKCTNRSYSKDITMLIGEDNDKSLKILLSGAADAMFVYADQADNYQCISNNRAKDGSKAAWNCTLWSGFGKDFAYVQTGQFGHVIKGTTFLMGKKGSGVAKKVNPCLAKFMASESYYKVCKDHHLVETCFTNMHFPYGKSEVKEFNKPTHELTSDCSTGYCHCGIGVTSGVASSFTVMARGVLVLIVASIVVKGGEAYASCL
eukprot:TRINITY_DN15318_c1_g2_i1.p1 TRINITY_DN15318_c1_g2~~TRINITY_DN15318_c1_g2_i1.p1  ORF type:complete len:364 (+),score=38.06 TRINITY_DN15318_c1_g2_i1:221-1312(+)